MYAARSNEVENCEERGEKEACQRSRIIPSHTAKLFSLLWRDVRGEVLGIKRAENSTTSLSPHPTSVEK